MAKTISENEFQFLGKAELIKSETEISDGKTARTTFSNKSSVQNICAVGFQILGKSALVTSYNNQEPKSNSDQDSGFQFIGKQPLISSDTEIRLNIQHIQQSRLTTQSEHLQVGFSPRVSLAPGSDYQFLGQKDLLASDESVSPGFHDKSSNGDSEYKILGKKPILSSEENSPSHQDSGGGLRQFVRQHTKGREGTPGIPEESNNECIDPFQHYLQEDRGGTFTR